MSVTSANWLNCCGRSPMRSRGEDDRSRPVIEAMEDLLGKAACSRYGAEYDIRARIDRKSGELFDDATGTWSRKVMRTTSPRLTKDARAIKPDAAISDFLTDRFAADGFRPHRRPVGEAGHHAEGPRGQRERRFEEFRTGVGRIINGVVKRTGII